MLIPSKKTLGGNEIFDMFRDLAYLGIDYILIAEKYFNICGYSKIRKELPDVKKIRIITGVDTSQIARRFGTALHFNPADKAGPHAKHIYSKEFIRHVADAPYYGQIENNIKELYADIKSGLTEFRIQPATELKTNIYHFTHEDDNPSYFTLDKTFQHSGFTASGNLSDSHLIGSPEMSMCRELRTTHELDSVKAEFENLWKESISVTTDDIKQFCTLTHLGQHPTPHQIYMKLLIDHFGAQVEEKLSFEFPEGYKRLQYQVDAVIQGYDMLLRHNGFFLADVVGLGKTIIATLIAKLFITNNGKTTKALIITPPGTPMRNWQEVAGLCGIDKFTHFVTKGSLKKVIDTWYDEYLPKEEYDLVIIDEADDFRNDDTMMCDDLQLICKSGRSRVGNVKGGHKKIIPVTATPFNNTPEDPYNLLRLFQDVRNSTISGVTNLQKYFAPKIAEYKRIMKDRTRSQEGRRELAGRIEALVAPIRHEVLEQVTIRRTRENLRNNPVYRQDLERQGIKLPEVLPPKVVNYTLDSRLSDLFGRSMVILTEKLHYARYRAIERFTEEHRSKYPKGRKISTALGTLYRSFLVKRLESSFEAFRLSLGRLLKATEVMIMMFDNDKVIIAPDLKINKLREEGWSFNEIIEEGMARLSVREDQFVYPASAFDSEFIVELHHDAKLLRELLAEWEGIDCDPKFDRFAELMRTELFDPQINPTGKLLIFSESKDTIEYLAKQIRETFDRNDVLAVSGANREKLELTIIENFDANYRGKQRNDYMILIATDCISESRNLHRANVLANYDTPFNPTPLIQRSGRINRVGSVADRLHNYMFYPSAEGNREIGLYENSIIKLQGMHSSYGEDNQIYSTEEIIRQFELFDPNVVDDEDKRAMLLNEVREFFNDHPEAYEFVKKLPAKSRVNRLADTGYIKGMGKDTSLAYVSSSYKNAYYMANRNEVNELTFLDAARLFEAKADEVPEGNLFDHWHFAAVGKAFRKYEDEIMRCANDSRIGAAEKDNGSAAANKFLWAVWRKTGDEEFRQKLNVLRDYNDTGVYSRLPKEIMWLKRLYDPAVEQQRAMIEKEIEKLYNRYYTEKDTGIVENEYDTPRIILSETFI